MTGPSKIKILCAIIMQLVLNTNSQNCETYDCNGICDGGAKIDLCGQCLSIYDVNWNNCIGCDGRQKSNKALNECGFCGDVNDADFKDYGKDCTGKCAGFLSNMHSIDPCGQCLLTSDPDWNACIGCDGIPFSGKSVNECGLCVSENDPQFDGYGRDCTGNCAQSSNTYYVDECGQCLLPTDSKWNECLQVYEPCNWSTLLPTTISPSFTMFSTEAMTETDVADPDRTTEADQPSMIMILIVINGILIFFLCLCGAIGVYLFYGKYTNERKVQVSYLHSIQMNITDDGKDTEVPKQNTDQTTALVQQKYNVMIS